MRGVCFGGQCRSTVSQKQLLLERALAHRVTRRRFAPAIATAMAVVLPTACAYKGLGMSPVDAVTLHGQGTLAAPTLSSTAETYNPVLAPVGARVSATLTPSGNSTTAELTVTGMLPNRGYAAHAHTNVCGQTGVAAGPHYQNQIDPAATPQKPSTDPHYANPRNEVWLDLRTDATGSGTARTTVPFVFGDRGPGSIVVHEGMETEMAPGKAGQAGARIACVTLAPQGQGPAVHRSS
jgi:superoxide dismutase, Cu-Zn family